MKKSVRSAPKHAGFLSPALYLCPEEAALIGYLLTNYGELEFELAKCLEAVLGDQATAFRVVYRDRGEERRINVCDALMRPHFAKLDLDQPFAATIDQVKFCKVIRNQYAHAWFSFSGKGTRPAESADWKREYYLKLVSLEDAVKSGGALNVKPKDVDVELLETQAAYFENAHKWLMYLWEQASIHAGEKVFAKPTPRPTRLEKPARYVEK